MKNVTQSQWDSISQQLEELHAKRQKLRMQSKGTHTLLLEIQINITSVKNNREVLQHLKRELPCAPANPALGI
jgi:hypothetical protein